MDAIIFDLDGTLADTLPLCIQAFREALEPLAGRRLADAEIIATFGPTEEGTIDVLAPHAFDEGLRRYLERYEALHHEYPAPFDGMTDVVRYLKESHVFVGMVTAKGARSTAMTLTQYGLNDVFDAVKTGARTGPIKDICIEELIHEHGLCRDRMLYVGDSPIDIHASRACRIRVAAAAWAPATDAEALRALRPDYIFTSVAGFFAFLKREIPGVAERGAGVRRVQGS